MVDTVCAHVTASAPRSCHYFLPRLQLRLHRSAHTGSARCSVPPQQCQKQTDCRRAHASRRSAPQQSPHCCHNTYPETHEFSRRTFSFCAASLAVQLSLACTAAHARPAATNDLAAATQPQSTQVLPEATTVLQPAATASRFKPGQKQVLAINKRVQTQNNAPLGFPNFVRDGYEIIILADGYQESPDGLIWKDFEEGKGSLPQDGQQVTFDYTAYNESGSRIDSTYTKGRPAQTRLGINGLIPGFEKGIKNMKVGGKRRLVISPALGPPVGPSTFFSAKQCEVFDVELLDVKSCRRRQVAMFSDVVCE